MTRLAAGTTDLPFRLRVCVIGSGETKDVEALSAALRSGFSKAVLSVLGDAARKSVPPAGHTPLTFDLLSATGSEVERLAVESLLAIQGSRSATRSTGEGPRRDPALVPGAAIEVTRRVVEQSDLVLVIGTPESRGEAVRAAFQHAIDRRKLVLEIGAAPPFAISVAQEGRVALDALDRLERFNRQTISLAKQKERERRDFAKMFQCVPKAAVADETRRFIQGGLLPFYSRASHLAESAQGWFMWAGKVVWWLFPVAVGAAALGILYPQRMFFAFWIELGALILILGVVLWADHTRSHERWVETRLLGERLRAAMHLIGSGSRPSGSLPLRTYASVETRGDWTSRAVEEIRARLPEAPSLPPGSERGTATYARRWWVREQIRYHRRKSEHSRRGARRLERWGAGAFFVGIAVAAAHLVAGPPSHAAASTEPLHALMNMLAIVLPAVGAAIGGFRAHRDYSRLAKRSASMAAALTEIDRELVGLANRDEIAASLRECEMLMLAEAEDWLMLMRSARVEVPG